MNMLLDVYICTLIKKCASLLPEGTVKCTHLWHLSKFTEDDN